MTAVDFLVKREKVIKTFAEIFHPGGSTERHVDSRELIDLPDIVGAYAVRFFDIPHFSLSNGEFLRGAKENFSEKIKL